MVNICEKACYIKRLEKIFIRLFDHCTEQGSKNSAFGKEHK